MRYVFLSDAHGQSSILRQVLDQVAGDHIDTIITLGDMGSDPCYDMLRAASARGTFGNCEVSGYGRLSPQNQAFVLGLPPLFSGDDFLAAHAVLRYPAGLFNVLDFAQYMRKTQVSWRTLFPYPDEEDRALWDIYAELEKRGKHLFFHGHTHRQQVWIAPPYGHPRKCLDKRLPLQAGTLYVVGVGSVGQPQDSPFPAYVIYDDCLSEVELRRLPQM